MVVIRCTPRLLERLPAAAESHPVQSTAALGDWYATPVFARPRLLVFVSEKSRLPVVIPAKGLEDMAERFREALERLLRELAVSDRAIEMELAAMETISFAKTADRSVLGSLNEFVLNMRWSREDRPDESLHELSLHLSHTPILPLKDFPDLMTRRLLEARTLN